MVLDRETDGVHSTIHCSPVNDPEQATALSFADFISAPEIYNIVYFLLEGRRNRPRFPIFSVRGFGDVSSSCYRGKSYRIRSTQTARLGNEVEGYTFLIEKHKSVNNMLSRRTD